MSQNLKLIFVIWMFLLLISELPGKIETKLFPIVTNFEYVLKESDNEDYETDMFLSFDKKRSSCSFYDIEFYMVEENLDTIQKPKIRSVYRGRETTRYAGIHFAGPWSINANIEELQNVDVKVYHDCHFTWKSVTEFSIRNGKVLK